MCVVDLISKKVSGSPNIDGMAIVDLSAFDAIDVGHRSSCLMWAMALKFGFKLDR